MSVLAFEIACAAVVLLSLAVFLRRIPWRTLLPLYLAIAIAAWAGEQSCIALYRFYTYAPGWHLWIGDVPALVPLIWPLVILSAREVVSALWLGAGAARAALVAAVVAFDASLVEVVAVDAGLWSWREPGHLGVPLIGILGWGCFAFAVDALRGIPGRLGWRLLPILAPLVTHLMLLALWWGGLRWVLRGDLAQAGFAGLAFLSLAATTEVLRARRRGRSLPPEVWIPRLVATSLFVALLLTRAEHRALLAMHFGLVALPYLAALSLRGAAPVAAGAEAGAGSGASLGAGE
ncbi:MAG: hypothetical protein D6729_18590 [Deltaproteobacteria bacterium]|nr:MAG: hypothetical protein D6729_18590 [Deltaproteobacteria bacterium]